MRPLLNATPALLTASDPGSLLDIRSQLTGKIAAIYRLTSPAKYRLLDAAKRLWALGCYLHLPADAYSPLGGPLSKNRIGRRYADAASQVERLRRVPDGRTAAITASISTAGVPPSHLLRRHHPARSAGSAQPAPIQHLPLAR